MSVVGYGRDVDDTSAMTAWDASSAWTGYRVRLTDGKWHDVPRANQSENQQAWLCCGVARTFRFSAFCPGRGVEECRRGCTKVSPCVQLEGPSSPPGREPRMKRCIFTVLLAAIIFLDRKLANLVG